MKGKGEEGKENAGEPKNERNKEMEKSERDKKLGKTYFRGKQGKFGKEKKRVGGQWQRKERVGYQIFKEDEEGEREGDAKDLLRRKRNVDFIF